jgi:transglutaminase-like putative cysteine protease
MKRRSVCAAVVAGLLAVWPGARGAEPEEVPIRQALEQFVKRFAELQQGGLGGAGAALSKQQAEHGPFHPKTVEARAELIRLLRRRDAMLTQFSDLLLLYKKLGKDAKDKHTLEQWLEKARQQPAAAPRSDSPVLGAYDYSAIDKHVRATPKDAERSLKELAAYLGKGAKNDREKARAVARWIVENVAYDYDGVVSGKWEREPAAVLKVRATDCGGQTALFETLAKACGLEVQTIPGKIRDADVNPAFRKYTTVSPLGFGYVAHAWNAVKLDGHWYMVDVTHINARAKRDGKVTAVAEPNWTFFLTPPHQFVYSRLPDDEKSQLLKTPIKKEEYEWLPMSRPALFRYKIETVSHPGPLVLSGDELVMTFKAPKDVLLTARLEQGGKELDARLCMLEREGTDVLLRVALPRAGGYTLGLYARALTAKADAWEDAIQYRVEAISGQAKPSRYPEMSPIAQEKGARLYLPFAGGIKAGDPVGFVLSLPGATAAVVKAGNQSVTLSGKDGIFLGGLKPGAGDVTLYVKYPDRKEYVPLARYKAE